MWTAGMRIVIVVGRMKVTPKEIQLLPPKLVKKKTAIQRIDYKAKSLESAFDLEK